MNNITVELHRSFLIKCKPKFDKTLLPNPIQYLKAQGINTMGYGVWVSALCPFHGDTSPSLRINMENGAFRCMACGEKGGDVLALHMKLHSLSFVDAAKQLGAWS